jgi:hypothetical protein
LAIAARTARGLPTNARTSRKDALALGELPRDLVERGAVDVGLRELLRRDEARAVLRCEVAEQLRLFEDLGFEQGLFRTLAIASDQVQNDLLLFCPNQAVRYEAFEEPSVPRVHG